MMSQDTIPDIVPLLQSEGMDSKEAKEEAVLLCLEYLLDTAFQSLRSAFLISSGEFNVAIPVLLFQGSPQKRRTFFQLHPKTFVTSSLVSMLYRSMVM